MKYSMLFIALVALLLLSPIRVRNVESLRAFRFGRTIRKSNYEARSRSQKQKDASCLPSYQRAKWFDDTEHLPRYQQ